MAVLAWMPGFKLSLPWHPRGPPLLHGSGGPSTRGSTKNGLRFAMEHSVFEARWLLVPVFALSIAFITIGLVAG
jgi:hypothetical protein